MIFVYSYESDVSTQASEVLVPLTPLDGPTHLDVDPGCRVKDQGPAGRLRHRAYTAKERM